LSPYLFVLLGMILTEVHVELVTYNLQIGEDTDVLFM